MSRNYLLPDLKGFFAPPQRRAVIATSRHGLMGLVKALPALTRATPVFCVGEATAQKAKDLKFKTIHGAQGTVEDLIQCITTHQASSFFYARGKDITYDLINHPTFKDLDIKEAVVYEAVACTQLTDLLVEKIRTGTVDRVLFYSKRTAEIFMHLMTHHNLMEQAQKMEIITISPAIADVFNNPSFKKVACTQGPDIEQVVKSIT